MVLGTSANVLYSNFGSNIHIFHMTYYPRKTKNFLVVRLLLATSTVSYMKHPYHIAASSILIASITYRLCSPFVVTISTKYVFLIHSILLNEMNFKEPKLVFRNYLVNSIMVIKVHGFPIIIVSNKYNFCWSSILLSIVIGVFYGGILGTF